MSVQVSQSSVVLLSFHFWTDSFDTKFLPSYLVHCFLLTCWSVLEFLFPLPTIVHIHAFSRTIVTCLSPFYSQSLGQSLLIYTRMLQWSKLKATANFMKNWSTISVKSLDLTPFVFNQTGVACTHFYLIKIFQYMMQPVPETVLVAVDWQTLNLKVLMIIIITIIIITLYLSWKNLSPLKNAGLNKMSSQ